MFKRSLFLPAALGLSIGVPYVAFNPELRDQVSSAWNSMGSGASADGVALEIGNPGSTNDAESDTIRNHVHSSDTSPLYTPRVEDFRDVIRFDVTPNWVKSRWPRVSACCFDERMEGFRVPLVTGPATDDLHGSLTYYFDEHHRVQRISFYGSTGDATRLIELVTQYHGFQARRTNHAGLFVRTYHGKPTGALRLSHASVVRASHPNEQMHVMLEINNTIGAFRLSDEFQQLLDAEHDLGRWN